MDFESYLPKSLDGTRENHEPSGFCLYRTSKNPGEHQPAYTYCGKNGDDVMNHFFERLMIERFEIAKKLGKNLRMTPLTDEQQKDYDAAEICPYCEEKFTAENYKVRHHSHTTSLFLAAACRNCNLQLKYRKRKRTNVSEDGYDDSEFDDYMIPVIAHNMRGYDSHHIIKYFRQKHFEWEDVRGFNHREEIEIIPTNTEQFIGFSIGNLRFIDSCQFLTTSLDKLVSVLLDSGRDKFVHTTEHFREKNLPNLDILFKKGVYPYEEIQSYADLEATRLPPQAAFYSQLNECGITDAEYRRAEEIWTTLGCTNMIDYHNLYLTTDVLLLADVFENFRDLGMQTLA